MTPTKLLTILPLALTTLALTTSTAAAEEKTKMLPESGVTYTFTQGPGKMVQQGGSSIDCKKGKGAGTIESANLGKYEILFEECTSTGGSICTGTGDATGTLLTKGIYHFWLALETLNGVAKTLVGALVYLPEEGTGGCTLLGVTVPITVKGCEAALATPLNRLVSTTKDTFEQASNGVQLIINVLPQEKTTEIECILLSKKGTGPFEQTSLVGVNNNSTFKKGAETVTILLMNPEAKE